MTIKIGRLIEAMKSASLDCNQALCHIAAILHLSRREENSQASCNPSVMLVNWMEGNPVNGMLLTNFIEQSPPGEADSR
jgi:hypothetical protein